MARHGAGEAPSWRPRSAPRPGRSTGCGSSCAGGSPMASRVRSAPWPRPTRRSRGRERAPATRWRWRSAPSSPAAPAHPATGAGASGRSGLELGGALGHGRLAVRGLVLVDHALARGLVQAAAGVAHGQHRRVGVTGVGRLAELAHAGLQRRLDGLVALPGLLVLLVALDLRLDVRHAEASLGVTGLAGRPTHHAHPCRRSRIAHRGAWAQTSATATPDGAGTPRDLRPWTARQPDSTLADSCVTTARAALRGAARGYAHGYHQELLHHRAHRPR